MTSKRARAAQSLIVILALIAGVVWKGQTIFSGWEGQVAEIRMPQAGGRNATVVVRDRNGKTFEILLPSAQAQQLSVGAQLAKDRFSLRVRLVALPSEEP